MAPSYQDYPCGRFCVSIVVQNGNSKGRSCVCEGPSPDAREVIPTSWGRQDPTAPRAVWAATSVGNTASATLPDVLMDRFFKRADGLSTMTTESVRSAPRDVSVARHKV